MKILNPYPCKKNLVRLSSLFILLSFNLSVSKNLDFITVDEQMDSQKYEDYLVAELELVRGKDLKEAEKRFHAFADNVDKERGYHGLIRTWLKMNKFDEILKVKNNFDISDLEIQLAYASAYVNTKKAAEAETLLAKLKNKYPKNEQVAYFYIMLLTNTNRVTQALAFIDSYLKKLSFFSPKHSYFYFLQAKIYVQLNKIDKALAAVESCLKLYPQFSQAWFLKALLNESSKNMDDAISSYITYLDISDFDEKVIRKVVVLLFNANRLKEAEKYLSKIKSSGPEYYFDLALIQAKAGNFKSALININQTLAKNNNFYPARLLKVEVLLKSGLKDQAIGLVFNWIEERPSDKVALGMIASLQQAGLSKEDLLKMLHGIVDKGIVHKNILAVLADLCVDTKKLQNALPYHKQILELTKDELLKSKIYYQMAYTYFVTGEQNKVEANLKKAIAMDEVFAPAYNLLAYYYAKNNSNLEYADWLIDKGLSEQPKDAAFLDTKGLIALKQGKRADAKRAFRVALNISPKDKIIAEHLKLASR